MLCLCRMNSTDGETASNQLTAGCQFRSGVRCASRCFLFTGQSGILPLRLSSFVYVPAEYSAELLITIEVLLEFNRVNDARVLARRCERKLKQGTTEFEEGLLRDALGTFYIRVSQPLLALEH